MAVPNNFMNRVQREQITTMNMHMMYADGKSMEQIGNVYGCTKNAVSQRFKRVNLCVRPQNVAIKLSMTPERIEKMREIQLQRYADGFMPWNKGLTKKTNKELLLMSLNKLKKREEVLCPTCGLTFYRNKHHFVKYCSQSCAVTMAKGKRNSIQTEFKKGQIPHNYKGGVNKYARKSGEVIAWRKKIFGRDNFTCNICEQVGGQLEAHHIKPWAKFKELRFDLKNGITLCKKCHKKVHKKVK